MFLYPQSRSWAGNCWLGAKVQHCFDYSWNSKAPSLSANRWGKAWTLRLHTDFPPESQFQSVELGIMSLVMKTIMLNLLTWLVPTLLPMIQNCGLALSTTGVNSLVTTSSDSFIQQESMPLIHFQTTGVKNASKSKARSKEFCLRQLCLADLQGSGTLFQGKTWTPWWVTNILVLESIC